MKKSISALCLIFLSLMVITPELWAQPTCVEANGLTWCYNNQVCGQACEEVCSTIRGGKLLDDDNLWLEAQNTIEKCQVISQALGLGENVDFMSYSYACLEDTFGPHTVGGELNGPLFCSSFDGCPANHRTLMDDQGIPCGPESRLSICPCELPLPSAIPTLTEWGLIAMAGLLGIIGFLVKRKKKITA
ncbi:MAG: IPTL-CTERM sorting domain-containing protein [Thermodesulfobacteriota bacterium]